MDSRFRSMVRTLRASLQDEKAMYYYMHTPVGVINVNRWLYKEPGFVFVIGEDEQNKLRFFVFSDEEACSFPLEVKRKPSASDVRQIGFVATASQSDEDQV